MKQVCFYVIILTFNVLTCIAAFQPPEVKHLKQTVKPWITSNQTQIDTVVINRINKVAELYFESYPDTTIYYATIALNNSRKLRYRKGIADASMLVANVESYKNNTSAAQSNFNTALKIYRQLNNKSGISEVYMGLGRLYDYSGKYNKALKLFNLAIAMRRAMGSDTLEAESYAVMGITYDNMGQYTKALDCYFRSLKNNLKHNNEVAAADNYNNIGVVLQHLKLQDKALQYFNRALDVWYKLNDRQGISTAFQNIGEVATAQKKYNIAILNLNKALNMFRNLGDEDGIDLAHYALGKYYYETNKNDSALHYFLSAKKSADNSKIHYNRALANCGLAMIYNRKKQFELAYYYALKAKRISEEINSRDLRTDATLQLSDALAGMNKFGQAFVQQKLYVTLNDSLESNASLQKMISYNLAIDFENSQKKAYILQKQKEDRLKEKIEKERFTNIIYSVVIVVITVLLIFYYNAKRKQTKANKLLEVQAKNLNNLNLLKNRLIAVLAHDLRAPISTLRSMFSLMADKDLTPEEFVEMVPRVNEKLENTSGFLDTLLAWINSQVDSKGRKPVAFRLDVVTEEVVEYLKDQLIAKEIEIVNNTNAKHIAYADPHCMRIVIHNLLTNAIKFSRKSGVIKLSAVEVDNGLIKFSVTDNGVGMDAEKLANLFKGTVNSNPGTLNETGTGMGLIFCKDLVELYNGRIWAESDANNGTVFSFTLSSAQQKS